MDAVKDPGCGANEAIEKLVKEWQVQLLRLCYILTMAVMNLPAKFRETIMLYYYQDMDTMEISKTLGIAQSSVSNRLRKGRELLCKALEGRDLHA